LALGYAPDAWDALGTHLDARRFPTAMVLQGGLVATRKSGQGTYDRFRNRLIFPIRDINGCTVAFGGRDLGDSPAKYINSPETPAYTKGDHLYGLHEARDKIRREGFAIVVEGYMDLAALVQAGFENVVASLGTAFTPAQARLLGRCTERVAFSYDGDSAGASATTRSLDLLLERGFDVRVVDLPGGQDPDDYIGSEGAAAYDRLVREAPGYLEFLLRRAMAGRSIDRVEDKVAAANEMLPHLAKIENAVERATWVGRLTDELDLEEGAVMQELRAALRTRTASIRQRPPTARPLRQAGARLVRRLVESEDERSRWVDELDLSLLDGSEVRGLVALILERARRGEPIAYPALLEALESRAEDSETLTRIAFHEEPEEGPDVEDCLCTFEKERLQRLGMRAVRQLRGGPDRPAAPDGAEEIDQQLLEIQQLARQRDALS
jgi:DNA primase